MSKSDLFWTPSRVDRPFDARKNGANAKTFALETYYGWTGTG